MPRPPTSDAIITTIEGFWVKEKLLAEKQKRKPNKARVWRQLHGSEHHDPWEASRIISKSAVEKIISRIEQQSPGKPWSLVEWHPWTVPEETAEDSAFLIRLNAIRRVQSCLNLFEYEAKWGRKLRAALEGLSPYAQYKMVCEYAMREVTTSYLGREQPFTEDLDAFLAYKPWLQRINCRAFFLAAFPDKSPWPVGHSNDAMGWEQEQMEDPSLESRLGEERLTGPGRSDISEILWTRLSEWSKPVASDYISDEMDPMRSASLEALLQFWARPDQAKFPESEAEEGNNG